jgi:hypothetical protein
MRITSQFMGRTIRWAIFVTGIFFHLQADSQQIPESKGLQIILMRHAEKPLDGDNLSCAGLNRSMQLPKLFSGRFGIPSYVYVPALSEGKATKHARMFQTVIPLAIKYNLAINSKYKVGEVADLAKEVLQKEGVVLIVWEHKGIIPIARALGVQQSDLQWKQDDYDSIWVITIANGSATLARQKEGLYPLTSCSF